MLSLIVATAKNGVIGRDNQMPWHLPADLAYFKRVTSGHPVIMGRKTFESIGRPLPNRHNIVVTRNANWRADGVSVATSLGAALEVAQRENKKAECFVIGGAQMYDEALPLASRIYLTEIDAAIDGDTRFPALALSSWREVSRETRPRDEKNAYDLVFVVLERA